MDPDERDESTGERRDRESEETIPDLDAGSGESFSGPLRPRAASARPASIGPYRIIDILGEGGMGIVYLAEQVAPVRRRVALKVIKLGMDTREVVARFEAERQALALLDHPGIARIYDGGASEEDLEDGYVKHAPVGSYWPNPFGFHDIAGDVCEWCQSLFKEYPHDPSDGREDLTSGGRRVHRGGSWIFGAGMSRSACRGWSPSDGRLDFIGVRLARTLE